MSERIVRAINVDRDLWEAFRLSLDAGKDKGCKSPMSATVESMVRDYLKNHSTD